jgi:hypothetical protein
MSMLLSQLNVFYTPAGGGTSMKCSPNIAVDDEDTESNYVQYTAMT